MIQHHGEFSHVCSPIEWGKPPIFRLGQRVQLNAKTIGTVFGFDYVAVGSWWHQNQVEPGWHYNVTWDESCSRSCVYPTEICHEDEIQALEQSVQPSYAELAAV